MDCHLSREKERKMESTFTAAVKLPAESACIGISASTILT